MTGTVSGLSRVTVVAPHTRMDLALPSDVVLADLLPALLRHAGGDLADEGTRHGGWALTRLGGAALDAGSTLLELDIRDGEVLYFTPRSQTQPEILFDDVVDAVATSITDRPPWTPVATRRFATGFALAALVGAGAVILLAGPPHLPGALTAVTLSLLLLLAAALMSRVRADSRTGALFGLVALGYGGLGGLLLLAADRPVSLLSTPDVLLAATGVVVLAAAATIAVGDHPQLFLGAAAIGAALALGAGITQALGAGPAVGAAVVAVAGLGAFPALPMVAYRVARLPVPGIPTGPDDLRSDTEQVDGERTLTRSERADEIHTGLIGTAAAVVAGAAVVLVLAGDRRSWLLGTVLALLLLLRARPYRGRGHRLPLLIAGTVTLGAVTAGIFPALDLVGRLALLGGGLVLAAAISLGYGLAVAGRRISPLWGRQLDLAEIGLLLSVVPLAAWVTGAYAWIATLGR